MSIIKLKHKFLPHKKDKIDAIMEECEQYRKDLIRYCSQFFEYEYHYAEDCVQDAYIALYDNLSQGIEISNYKSWLYKVVLNYKNKAIKDKIQRNEQDFLDNEEKDQVLNNTLSYEPDFVENMITEETIEERMLIILSSLNKNEQYLYFSHYHDKKNLKIIAQEMGISHTAVRQRHVELTKKIKKMIKEYEKS